MRNLKRNYGKSSLSLLNFVTEILATHVGDVLKDTGFTQVTSYQNQLGESPCISMRITFTPSARGATFFLQGTSMNMGNGLVKIKLENYLPSKVKLPKTSRSLRKYLSTQRKSRNLKK